MRKNVIALLAGILLIPLSLVGCGTQGKQLSDVQKISYIGYCGHQADCGTVFVLTPDCSVKEYDITWDYKYTDLFAGKLPSEDEYELIEYQISEEKWNALINTMNENRFMALPEDISIKGYDMSTAYIQVETADVVHKSGGYGASLGKDGKHERFQAIENELWKLIKAHQSSSYY